jgi:hypothetical protein
MRIRSLIYPALFLSLVACNKEEEAVTQRDTSYIAMNQEPVQGTTPKTDTIYPAPSPAGSSTPQQPAPATRQAPTTQQPQIIRVPDNAPTDPRSQMIPPQIVDRNVPLGGVPLLPAATLAQFHPKHPMWPQRGRINNKDVPGVHESITLLKNVKDSTHTIRSTVIDQDERTAHTLINQMSALRKQGSITQYPDGEPVTAYFVQIDNALGSRAYIPSKKVATLTLMIGDHRLIQLREEKAENTDNLMEVAMHIDLRKFESLH